MSSKKFNPFKDFQSDQIQRSSCKIFTGSLRMQECRSYGFIFQIINLLIESWGVRLTCLDYNNFKLLTSHYFSLLLSTSMLWYCRLFEQSGTVYHETSSLHNYWMLFSLVDGQAHIKRNAISNEINNVSSFLQ